MQCCALIRMLGLCGQAEPAEETLASLLKRSKSHQFYGLMGKRSGKIWFCNLQELCSVYLVVLQLLILDYYHKIQWFNLNKMKPKNFLRFYN